MAMSLDCQEIEKIISKKHQNSDRSKQHTITSPKYEMFAEEHK